MYLSTWWARAWQMWSRQARMNEQAGQVVKHTGWKLFIQTMLARSYPRIIGQMRETSWLLFDILMPLGATIGYVLVYKALKAAPEYIGFVVMGGAMMAFWMNVLWGMSSQ